MRVLFLSGWLPYPTTNGSKLRIFNLLRALAARHDVALLTFADGIDRAAPPPALRALCREVDVVPWAPVVRPGARALAGLFRPVPRSVQDEFSPTMARRIGAACASGSFDLIVASQLRTACYAPYFAGVPALFEEVELGVPYDRFARAPTTLARVRHGLTWAKHRRYVARVLTRFRACTVVSEAERRLLAAAVPQAPRVTVIPNLVDVAVGELGGARDPDALIFAGSLRYVANRDAMRWFTVEVLPRIRARRPAAHLTVTGDPGDAVLAPTPGVVLAGVLDDVRGAIASAAVSVVPLRIGGGTRLKILESMALGTPVVTTSKGAEGLEVVGGEHVLIADDPQEFADHVVRLLGDGALREQLAARGRALVARCYDRAVVGSRFTALVEEVARAR